MCVTMRLPTYHLSNRIRLHVPLYLATGYSRILASTSHRWGACEEHEEEVPSSFTLFFVMENYTQAGMSFIYKSINKEFHLSMYKQIASYGIFSQFFWALIIDRHHQSTSLFNNGVIHSYSSDIFPLFFCWAFNRWTSST